MGLLSPAHPCPALPCPTSVCFQWGTHGHRAQDCASGAQGHAQSVASSYMGEFSAAGSRSLYTAHSTGRM